MVIGSTQFMVAVVVPLHCMGDGPWYLASCFLIEYCEGQRAIYILEGVRHVDGSTKYLLEVGRYYNEVYTPPAY